MTLPDALRPWAATLSTMDLDLATALGPLLRELDEFINAATATHPHQGEPDGFGGIGRKGEPERLLVSEWALAQHFPHEFLRRAATGELLYTTPEFTEPHRQGQAAVLVDAGPDQLGAARLVQLAALIVLRRREPGLLLGVLGDEPGTWRPAHVKRLLDARRTTRPDPADVERWADTVDDLWVLGGPRLTARRRLTTTESAWDEQGATAVRVELNGLATELTLPGRRHGVRLLRGNLRTAPEEEKKSTGVVRFPSFPGAEKVLLARGSTDRDLVTLRVLSGIQRTHRLPGRLLAAAQVHTRLVTLVEQDGFVRAHVIGNQLKHLNRLRVPAAALGIDPEEVAAGGLAPLYLCRDAVLCRWDEKGKWWSLRAGEPPERTRLVVLAPGVRHADDPRMAESPVLFGPGLSAAPDDRCWRVHGRTDGITVPEGVRLLGLHLAEDGTPGIVFQEGLILRVRTSKHTRTLTAWSGAPAVVHPMQPWVAVPRDDGRVEVGHLLSGERIATMRGDA
jgi:hypothetical protein